MTSASHDTESYPEPDVRSREQCHLVLAMYQALTIENSLALGSVTIQFQLLDQA